MGSYQEVVLVSKGVPPSGDDDSRTTLPSVAGIPIRRADVASAVANVVGEPGRPGSARVYVLVNAHSAKLLHLY